MSSEQRDDITRRFHRRNNINDTTKRNERRKNEKKRDIIRNKVSLFEFDSASVHDTDTTVNVAHEKILSYKINICTNTRTHTHTPAQHPSALTHAHHTNRAHICIHYLYCKCCAVYSLYCVCMRLRFEFRQIETNVARLCKFNFKVRILMLSQSNTRRIALTCVLGSARKTRAFDMNILFCEKKKKKKKLQKNLFQWIDAQTQTR